MTSTFVYINRSTSFKIVGPTLNILFFKITKLISTVITKELSWYGDKYNDLESIETHLHR